MCFAFVGSGIMSLSEMNSHFHSVISIEKSCVMLSVFFSTTLCLLSGLQQSKSVVLQTL